MQLLIALSIVYILGFNLSYWMLTTEHKAEGQVYTHGDRIVCLLLSLLSWLTIIYCLISSWVGKIQRLGYWDKPIQAAKHPEPAAQLNGKPHKSVTA